MRKFNPNDIGIKNGNIFGFPFTKEEAKIIIIPIPWDATTSYHNGTADGPEAILEASTQLDFQDLDYPNAWKMPIFMQKTDRALLAKNEQWQTFTKMHIKQLENDEPTVDTDIQNLNAFNLAHADLNTLVYDKATAILKQDKLAVVLGGEHSSPLGLIQALANQYESFGILQIDAHADLRANYEGFTYSHASIMHHAIKIKNIDKLVQVGIRDICPEEVICIEKSNNRIQTFYDQKLKERLFEGENWEVICNEIIEQLPQKVYISFDIDGLNPNLCPNTGTPVPGGLSFDQAIYLIKKLVQSGRQIIGFDLCEVAPGRYDNWDANVGARILFKLSLDMLKSNNMQ